MFEIIYKMFIVLLTSMYHLNVNINLMVGNIIQIKSRITTNVNVTVKNIIYVKNITFDILLHTAASMVNI